MHPVSSPHLGVLAVLGFLALTSVGCAKAAAPTARAPGRSSVFDAHTFARYAFGPSEGSRVLDPRKPGDFAVFSIVGSFRVEPATFTERVIAREGGTLVVDYELADVTGKEHLRVSLDLASANPSERFGEPTEAAAFEALRARTTLDVKLGQELFATGVVTRTLGGKAHDCQETIHRVFVGAREATQTSTSCDGFVWGDVETEIVGDDGEVLYRRELLEIGESDPSKPIFVASRRGSISF